MPSDLATILKLEVPVIVRLGRRELPLGDVMAWISGAIVELPKGADDELELLVNNKVLGTGKAVKVGENFGIRISFVGDLKARLAALGATPTPPAAAGGVDAVAGGSDADAAALAEQMMSGQS